MLTTIFSKNKEQVFFLILLFLLGIFFLKKFPHSVFHLTSDSYEYGNIAKNIIEKKGFFVNNLYPIQLAFEFSRETPVPSVLRMPLYPIVLSLFFKIFGISDKTILIVSFSFYIISGFLFLIFIENLKVNKNVKFLSLIFFMLNPIYLDLTLKGLSEPLAVSLFILFLIFLFKENKLFILFSSFFLSLLALTRYYIILLFLLPVIFYLYSKKNLKLITVYLFFLLIPLLPWLYRTYKLTGNPIFNLAFYTLGDYEIANIPYLSSYQINFYKFIETKIDSLFFYLKTLSTVSPFYLFPFSIIFLFKNNKNFLKNLKVFFILSLIIFSLVFGVLNPEHRFILYLSVFIIPFSIIFLTEHPQFLKVFLTFVFLLTVHENKNVIKEAIRRNNNFFKSREVLKEIEKVSDQKGFFISNADALIGFYTNKTCLFPLTYARDYEFLFKLVKVKGIIIFQGIDRLFYMKYSFNDIKCYLEREFPIRKTFTDGTVLFLKDY
ncbi:MAG: hypothetical protein ABDH37_02755 [Candidatus Hydrothermales bacterium]